MPSTNEHVALLPDQPPFNLDTVRCTKAGAVVGWTEGRPPVVLESNALRFPAADWTADKARKWLQDNKIAYSSFEPASEQNPEARETRTLVAEFEPPSTRSEDKPVLVGYAALFNKPAELWPDFIEKIAPGAFARTLREGADVRALVDHDSSQILGRNKAGTLSLEENTKGLKVRIEPPDTTVGRDIVTNIRAGNVDQMSFAFRTVAVTYEEKKDGTVISTLEDVDLFDVSVVTYPAYKDTKVDVRFHDVTIARQEFEAWRSGQQAVDWRNDPETLSRRAKSASAIADLTARRRQSNM